MTTTRGPFCLPLLAALLCVAAVTLSAPGLATSVSTTTVTDPGDDAPVPGDTQMVLDLTVASGDTVLTNGSGAASDPTAAFEPGPAPGPELFVDDGGTSAGTYEDGDDVLRLERLTDADLDYAGKGLRAFDPLPSTPGAAGDAFLDEGGSANTYEDGEDVLRVTLVTDGATSGILDGQPLRNFGATVVHDNNDDDANTSYEDGDAVVDDVGGAGTYSAAADSALAGTPPADGAPLTASNPWAGATKAVRFADDPGGTADGVWEAAADVVVVDDDEDGVYTGGADGVVDTDGTASAGSGSSGDTIAAGDPLTGFVASDDVRVDDETGDGYTADDDVYLDDDGLPGLTVADTLILDGGTAGDGVTGTDLPAENSVLVYNDEDGSAAWTDGEDIVDENVHGERTYSAAADVRLAGTAPANGTALTDTNPWAGATKAVRFADDPGGTADGVWEADSDVIVVDDDEDSVYTDGADAVLTAGANPLATGDSLYGFASEAELFVDQGTSPGTYEDGEDVLRVSIAHDGATSDTLDGAALQAFPTVGGAGTSGVSFVDDGTAGGSYQEGDDVVRVTRVTDGGTTQSLDGATVNQFAANVGYVDDGGSGAFEDGETIYREGDDGAPRTHDFGDDVDAVTVANGGSLADADIDSVALFLGGSQVAATTAPEGDGAWVLDVATGVADVGPAGATFTVRATVGPDAPADKTLNFSVPLLADAGTADAFDPGDRGLFFEQDAAVGDLENGAEITVDPADAITAAGISFVDPTEGDRTKVELAFSRRIDDSRLSTADFAVAGADGDAVSVAEVETGAAADDGQIVLDLATSVRSVRVATVNVSANAVFTTGGGAISARNVSVRTTSRTLRESAGTAGSAYRGERVAVYADDGSNLDERIEVESDTDGDDTYETFVSNGSTGDGSQLLVFDTANRDVSHAFRFTFLSSDGTPGQRATMDLIDLGLTATARDATISTDDDLLVDVGADVGDRDVAATLIPTSGANVSTTATLDGDGEATVDFGAQLSGSYTVYVTDADTGIIRTTGPIDVTRSDGRTGDTSSGPVSDGGRSTTTSTTSTLVGTVSTPGPRTVEASSPTPASVVPVTVIETRVVTRREPVERSDVRTVEGLGQPDFGIAGAVAALLAAALFAARRRS